MTEKKNSGEHWSLPVVSERIEKRLEELLALDTNWDSYGSEKISDKAVEASRKALQIIVERDPFVAPCSDGGVALEWHWDDITLTIEFDSDGKLVED